MATQADLRSRLHDLINFEESKAIVANWFNRALLDLAPVLLLRAVWEQAWAADTESYTAPTDILEFHGTGKFVVADDEDNQTALRRVQPTQVKQGQSGWWYDGTNIGIRPVPSKAGTFYLPYLQQPTLFDYTDDDQEPQGGPLVEQCLMDWGAYEFYRRDGNEESSRIAMDFYQSYSHNRAILADQRRRLMNAAPPAWGRAEY